MKCTFCSWNRSQENVVIIIIVVYFVRTNAMFSALDPDDPNSTHKLPGYCRGRLSWNSDSWSDPVISWLVVQWSGDRKVIRLVIDPNKVVTGNNAKKNLYYIVLFCSLLSWYRWVQMELTQLSSVGFLSVSNCNEHFSITGPVKACQIQENPTIFSIFFSQRLLFAARCIFFFEFNVHWIGLRENLNRKPWFLPSNWLGFPAKFSHHPILWNVRFRLWRQNGAINTCSAW